MQKVLRTNYKINIISLSRKFLQIINGQINYQKYTIVLKYMKFRVSNFCIMQLCVSLCYLACVLFFPFVLLEVTYFLCIVSDYDKRPWYLSCPYAYDSFYIIILFIYICLYLCQNKE